MITSYAQQAIARIQQLIRRLGWFTIALLAAMVVAAAAFVVLTTQEHLHDNLLTFILVGFMAQIIDGALGMAYGVSSTTFLLSTGVSPAAASASVHIAEVFTTLASGVSHWRLGNVDRRLFARLLVPGIIGPESITAIGELIRGARCWTLQGYLPANAADKSFRELPATTAAEAERLAALAAPFAEKVALRGKFL